MKRVLFAVSFVAVALAVCPPSSGALLFYEGFSYPPGDLNNQGIWQNNDTDTRTVSAGDLAPATWTGFASTGNHAGPDPSGKRNSGQINAAAADLWANDGSGGTIYVSAILKGNNNLNLNTEHTVGFNGALLNMQVDGASQGAFAQHNNGDRSGEKQTPFGNGGDDVKLWVWKIEHDGGPGLDTISAFVSNDPNLDVTAEPTFNMLVGKQQNHDSNMGWRLNIAGGGNDSSVDELRIATTFADAVRGVPEPSTLIVLGLGGTLLLWLRRRTR